MNRLLIDLANIASGILPNTIISSPDDIEKWKEVSTGIPTLVPADQDLLNFDPEDIFIIEENKILELIYGLSDPNYVGFKLSYPNNKFIAKFTLKNNVIKAFNSIKKQNEDVKSNVRNLVYVHETVGGFQTRNVPHHGHEKIIEFMLNHCSHVVINPVVGSKKSGDIKIDQLGKIFNDIIKPKFGGRVSFLPVTANMFYAGPREAVHHAVMRKNLGFTHFSVGRDHAGADGVYSAEEAPMAVKSIHQKLDISIITHSGAYYCRGCEGAVVRGNCGHSCLDLEQISGSDFREHLFAKKEYPHADILIQKYLWGFGQEIFEK